MWTTAQTQSQYGSRKSIKAKSPKLSRLTEGYWIGWRRTEVGAPRVGFTRGDLRILTNANREIGVPGLKLSRLLRIDLPPACSYRCRSARRQSRGSPSFAHDDRRRSFVELPARCSGTLRRAPRQFRLHGNDGAFAFLVKREFHPLAIPVDNQHVAETHLFGRQQVGQRIYHEFLNRSLQMPRSALEVCPFTQQEFPRRRRGSEQKLSSPRI